MPELRLNMMTREWVVVVCERARKPESFRARSERKYRPERDASCPFCPGNEGKTPAELMRLPGDGDWRVRVTPNKYAAFITEGERIRTDEGLRHLVTGVGRHEVIVESPRHDMALALLSEEEVGEVLAVYRERFLDAFEDSRIRHAIIFKNQGPGSGTSIMHPHTQLVGSPIVPFRIRDRIDEAVRYFDNTGECLVCAMLRDELADGMRVIVESEHFVSFIPYAALSPFHTWIFPKRHIPSFGNITEEEQRDLASTLKTTLLKLYEGLDDPDYNMVFRSLSPYRTRSEYLHWYITIVPRMHRATGFELGSGMYVNTTIPEDVASFLRGVRVS
jgi:UDPglucose--hexose-1-phosphate uridylyltransferase